MWSVNLRFQCASCNFVFMENFIDSIRISCNFLVFSLFLGCSFFHIYFPYCFFRLILCLSLRRYKVFFFYIWWQIADTPYRFIFQSIQSLSTVLIVFSFDFLNTSNIMLYNYLTYNTNPFPFQSSFFFHI